MNYILTFVIFFLAIVISVATVPDGALGVLLCLGLLLISLSLIKRVDVDRDFLVNIFLGALLVRIVLGFAIYSADLQFFFAPDALTYDLRGYELLQYYTGATSGAAEAMHRADSSSMYYIVALIYLITGRNPLNVQLVNAVFGAATAVLTYLCASHIYRNRSVARNTAIFIGFFPSLILWTSLGLKDGLIMFLIAFCTLMTLKLNEKFNLINAGLLLLGLMGIIGLRFYIFFIIIAAIFASFVLGQDVSIKKLAIRAFAILSIGLGLMYLGVLQRAEQEFKRFDSLEKAQTIRKNMGEQADSNFSEGTDVSTTGSLIQTLPIGIAYVMLSPFPWDIKSVRQVITLPEMIIWWLSIPIFIYGLIYIVRNKFRQSIFILVFGLLLTLSYAVFQGNTGTAYRHRAQIQMFYFIILSVGIAILQEYRGNRRMLAKARNRLAIPLKVQHHDNQS